MKRLDVAVATCAVLPEPDPDAAPLLRALADAGLRAESVAWDDPAADFGAARATVLRSTWNYPEHPEAFARWIEATARVTTLWNPARVVLWNMHKSYLLDLARAGVPVTPTRLVRRGEGARLDEVVAELGAREVVVKPAVSAGSRKTLRVGPEDRARGEAHLAAIVAEEDALVQPYLTSVEGYGERALVWIDGALTHAVRKSPRFAGGVESVSEAVPIADDEAELARRALAQAPEALLYARIDMARDANGQPVVMELELIEPSLFFPQCPAALDRYVAAVKARL